MLHRRLILANLAIHGWVAPLRGDSAMGLLTPTPLKYSVAPIKQGNLQDPKKTHPSRRGGGHRKLSRHWNLPFIHHMRPVGWF